MTKKKAKGYEPIPDEDVEDVVSEFVVFLVNDYFAKGGQLKTLSEKAELADSAASQIKDRKYNVTQQTASKLAPHLGFADYRQLVNVAYEWWEGDRSRRPPTPADSPIRAALEQAAKAKGYTSAEVQTAWLVASKVRGDVAVTPEQAEEILARARLFIRDGMRSLGTQPIPGHKTKMR